MAGKTPKYNNSKLFAFDMMNKFPFLFVIDNFSKVQPSGCPCERLGCTTSYLDVEIRSLNKGASKSSIKQAAAC